MGRIVISTNMSLDGVVEDPDGHEGFERGGWFGGPDLEQWAGLMTKEALGASALLLGRRSDEWFATRWAARTGEWADRLNGLPKYVVTSAAPRWSNATAVTLDEVARLTSEIGGEVLVYASYDLVQALIEHDLVDELRVVVFPVVLGAGRRLFGPTGAPKALRLVDVRTIGSGLVSLSYRGG